jgi:hypothetical protein
MCSPFLKVIIRHPYKKNPVAFRERPDFEQIAKSLDFRDAEIALVFNLLEQSKA